MTSSAKDITAKGTTKKLQKDDDSHGRIYHNINRPRTLEKDGKTLNAIMNTYHPQPLLGVSRTYSGVFSLIK